MARTKAVKPQAVLSEIEILFEDGQPTDEALVQAKSQAIRDIFGPGSNPKRRYVTSYDQVAQYSSFLKGLGLKVVYTSGVWDLPHIGHCRYLQKAKEFGDILIVGVELDTAVRLRKGPTRPVVPFNERVEMLCHIRHVDLVVPIPDFDANGLQGMKMLQSIRPNVFIASRRSLGDAKDPDIWKKWVGEEVKPYCDQIEILESQAETSTSNKIRDLVLGYGDALKQNLKDTRATVLAALSSAWEDMEQKIDETARKL